MIKKVKNTVTWTYVVSDLKGEEIIAIFYERQMQDQIKKSLELKKSNKKRRSTICYMEWLR